jgi:hypothetical protein
VFGWGTLLKMLGGVRGTLYAAAIAVLSLAVGVQTARLHLAQNALARAETQRDAARATVTACQARSKSAYDSAKGWRKVSDERGDLLATCQVENRRVAEAGRKAEADLLDLRHTTQRDLDVVGRRVRDQSAEPGCAQALATLDRACPALSDY